MPAVSVISTGPSGRISIAFATGSVVVPGTSETMAACWPVNALIKLDFPALRRPKMLICSRDPAGVSFNDVIIDTLPLSTVTEFG